MRHILSLKTSAGLINHPSIESSLLTRDYGKWDSIVRYLYETKPRKRQRISSHYVCLNFSDKHLPSDLERNQEFVWIYYSLYCALRVHHVIESPNREPKESPQRMKKKNERHYISAAAFSHDLIKVNDCFCSPDGAVVKSSGNGLAGTGFAFRYRLQPRGREREMFYLTTHSTHFIYGYMASDIWLRTIMIVRKETRCRHIGYSYRLTARVLLYAPSHRQDNIYHGLCYTSRGALAGTRNSSNPERVFKDPVGRCKATTPSSFSMTCNSVTT